MHWGETFLNELSKRGVRYGVLSYEDHQLLKKAESEDHFRSFLSTRYPDISTSNKSLQGIANVFAKRWKTENQSRIEFGLLQGLFSANPSFLVVLLLFPFLALRWIVRKFTTSE